MAPEYEYDHTAPDNMLPRRQNCVAMAFSKMMSLGVHATINYFIHKKWVPTAKALENDGAIEKVIKGIELAEVYKRNSWSTVKTGMKGHKDGRYFAINRGASPDHAFCIIVKNGSVGVSGNNAETKENCYYGAIQDNHKISVWGPYVG